MGKPKYISGLSALTDTGLGVVIKYSTEFGYDRIAAVRDVTPNLSNSVDIDVTYSFGRVTVFYKETFNNISTRNLEIQFESGETTKIEMFVPVTGQAIVTDGVEYNATLEGVGRMFSFDMDVTYGPRQTSSTSAFAMLPGLDPYNKFGYTGIWETESQGSQIRFGSDQTEYLGGIDHLGVPFPGPATQFVHYAASVGGAGQFNTAGDLWGSAWEGGVVVFAFLWSKDLEELKPDSVRFIVCNDSRSPSYYRTTGNDSDGNVIPAEYLNGSRSAIFESGSCTVDASPFVVYIQPTSPSTGGDGEIFVTVSSNKNAPPKPNWIDTDEYAQDKYPTYGDITAETFTFELTKIDGTKVTVGPAIGNTHKFTGLDDSRNPYTVGVLDAASGSTTTISVTVDDDKNKNCACRNDSGAINFYGGPVIPGPDCIPCIGCSTGKFLIDGNNPGEEFMLLNNFSATEPSTAAGTDGALSFSSEINSNILQYIATYIPGTFEINLYATTGNGGTLGALIDQRVAHPSASTDFTGLVAGWYAVEVFVTGQLCKTVFYREVVFTASKTPCVTEGQVSWDVDPCTGVVTASVNTSLEYKLLFSNGGGQYWESVTVAAGEDLYILVQFDKTTCTNLYVGPLAITAGMMNCLETGAVVGCTDPTALNYDPGAVIDSGTCLYGISGCTDPTATNYNPEATTDDGSCYDACPQPMIASISLSVSDVPTIAWTNEPASYILTWTNQTTGEVLTSTTGSPTFVLSSGAWLVTLVNSFGCTDFSVVSVGGIPIYYGCMDTLATNFQPAANLSYTYYESGAPGTSLSGACTYRIGQSECVPSNLATTLDGIVRCISKKSSEFVNTMKAGRLTPCTENHLRVLHLIKYLLERRGLDCIYNCQDSQTPDPEANSCTGDWTTGGPSGASLIYSATATYVWGDIVKSPDTDNIYTVISQTPITGVGPEDPNTTDKWQICLNTSLPSSIINRLDPYLAKVKDICRDCGIDVEALATEQVSFVTVETTTMTGTLPTIEGVDLNLT